MSVEQVLVYTRLAADKVGPTKMDRCEDVQPSLHTGKVYVACTNNTDRGKTGKEAATEANPRNENRDGHIVEITETGDQTVHDVHLEPADGLRRSLDQGRHLLRRLPGGQGLPDLLPGQPRVRLGGQPLDLHRRRALRHRQGRRAVQGHPRRRRARTRRAVPRRPARRRDLRARSSTTRNAPCSSPCSTRARTAPSTRSCPSSRTTSRPGRRRPGAKRAPPAPRSSRCSARTPDPPSPSPPHSNAGSHPAHVGALDGRYLTPRCFWGRGASVARVLLGRRGRAELII